MDLSEQKETKIMYYIDDEDTPYLIRIPKTPGTVTLLDLKTILLLPRTNYKFFFKSADDEFGIVKEEIADDETILPLFKGRVVSYIVSDEGSQEGTGSHSGTEIDVTNSHVSRNTSSCMTSDVDSTLYSDSETASRISTSTDETSVSRIHANRQRRRKRRPMQPSMSQTSSLSSITDSSMSLSIITVTLNLDAVTFLGISIVGQSNQNGDGGIYVGSIMKGGAVALDGRIEPGDMILQVNDTNFENMSNDEAVRVLRDAVQKPGPVKLVVVKCWDPSPKDYFSIRKTEPVRPIDPGAWVAHTEAARGTGYPMRIPSISTLMSTNSSMTSSLPESEQPLAFENIPLSIEMDMISIAKLMAAPDSGLEVRDRTWLKINIPNAFLGSDVVDWLHSRVQGFQDRRQAKKYATQMLKQGLIKHSMNKNSFSEQCYYVFGDVVNYMPDVGRLRLNDEDQFSEHGTILASLPPPSNASQWDEASYQQDAAYAAKNNLGDYDDDELLIVECHYTEKAVL